jgi:hypothetical protein
MTLENNKFWKFLLLLSLKIISIPSPLHPLRVRIYTPIMLPVVLYAVY